MSADIRKGMPRELWPIADWCDHVACFNGTDPRLPGQRVVDCVEAAEIYLRDHPAATSQLLALMTAPHPVVIERFRGAALRGSEGWATVAATKPRALLSPAELAAEKAVVDRAEAAAIATSTPRAPATAPAPVAAPPAASAVVLACAFAGGLLILGGTAFLVARLCQ